MRVPRAMLHFHVDYMAWADQEILRACATLSDEEVDRDLGISHRSILGTLRHMFVAEYDWVVRLHQGLARPEDEVDAGLLFPDAASGLALAELSERWGAVWPQWRELVESVADEALDGAFVTMGVRIPRWTLIEHVVNHATLHRGQVAGMLRQLGKQPPCTDQFEFHKITVVAVGEDGTRNCVLRATGRGSSGGSAELSAHRRPQSPH